MQSLTWGGVKGRMGVYCGLIRVDKRGKSLWEKKKKKRGAQSTVRNQKGWWRQYQGGDTTERKAGVKTVHKLVVKKGGGWGGLRKRVHLFTLKVKGGRMKYIQRV